MSALTAYLALATLPLTSVLASFSNIVELSWGFHHGLAPKPREVRDRAEAFNRYAILLRNVLLSAAIVILAQRNSIPAASLGLHLHSLESNVALGVTGAGIFLVLQTLMRSSLRCDSQLTHDVRRGSAPLWVCIFFVGAFSEEFWVALCLVTLIATGHATSISILFVTVVFVAMHYQYYQDACSWAYRFGAVLSIALRCFVSALLFLWTRSLLPPSIFHLVVNLGALSWAQGAPLDNREVSPKPNSKLGPDGTLPRV